jgi:hypothetical protein
MMMIVKEKRLMVMEDNEYRHGVKCDFLPMLVRTTCATRMEDAQYRMEIQKNL